MASVGAVLGIINTWRAMDRDRVNLRVTTKTAIPFNIPGLGDDPILCIEVLNLSAFPVTVTQVGFSLGGDQRLVLIDPIISPTQTRLPIRLEPRTSITCYAAPGTERHPLPQSKGGVRVDRLPSNRAGAQAVADASC